MCGPGRAWIVQEGLDLESLSKKLQYLVRQPNSGKPPPRGVCQR